MFFLDDSGYEDTDRYNNIGSDNKRNLLYNIFPSLHDYYQTRFDNKVGMEQIEKGVDRFEFFCLILSPDYFMS